MKDKIYISGAMSGIMRHHYKPKFDIAANYLQTLGYDVVNPVTLDEQRDNIINNPHMTEEEKWHMMIEDDLKIIESECNGIYMLDDWRYSKGALIEHNKALELGLEIMYEENNVNIM